MTACLGQSGFNKVLYAIVASQLAACGGSGGGGSATGVSTGSGTTGVSTGSIALKWTAPATRADGTPMSLAEIGGFRIYYGKSVSGYSNVVDVNDGVATLANLIDIPVGNYSLVMTTYDTAGRESVFSPVVTKTVQQTSLVQAASF